MKPFDPIVLQVVRRFIMVIGFSFFVVFAYKATKDVSNVALASGSPFRKKPPTASLSTQPVHQASPGFQATAPTLDEPAQNTSNDKHEGYNNNAKSIKSDKVEAEFLQNVEPVKVSDKKSPNYK